jgi:hypothetical protein
MICAPAPDGLTYMVMEYVEGRSLDKELKERGRFTPAEALQVLITIASVLTAAHASGVVHRDLKPENVMVTRTPDGELNVKLLDLGIAKLHDVAETQVSDGGALTVVGQILGTPYYMSPEQWGDMPRDGNPEIDGRADIYSLGIMFYELVSGHKPFTGHSLAELRRNTSVNTCRCCMRSCRTCPKQFARAVERAMAKDRADRPETAAKFATELRAGLGITHVNDVPPSVSSSAQTIANADPASVTSAPRAAAPAPAMTRAAASASAAGAQSLAPPASQPIAGCVRRHDGVAAVAFIFQSADRGRARVVVARRYGRGRVVRVEPEAGRTRGGGFQTKLAGQLPPGTLKRRPPRSLSCWATGSKPSTEPGRKKGGAWPRRIYRWLRGSNSSFTSCPASAASSTLSGRVKATPRLRF